jgi:hypothetical protein
VGHLLVDRSAARQADGERHLKQGSNTKPDAATPTSRSARPRCDLHRCVIRPTNVPRLPKGARDP